MSTLKVSNVVPKDGETMNLGESGSDTVVPVGSTITNNGTAIGFGGSGGPSATRVYSTSGTWTKPDNVSTIMVEVQGAGGSGSSSSTASNVNGGGGGGYARKLIDVSSISSATITVGSGGAGVSPSSVGNDGGESIWSDGTNTVTASGGLGATITTYDETPGGSASGGDLNITGGLGHAGSGFESAGGSSIFGTGGQGGYANESNRITVGNGYGGGGGGTYNAASGPGTNGVVVVTEYSEAGASGSGGGGSSSSGNILQVLQATKSDTTSTNSNAFVSTGLEATITPINSSSKILVTVVFSYGAGADANSLFQLHRDSTAIHLGDAAGNRIRTSIGTSYQNTGTSGLENGTINALDTPATASPITYKLMFAKGNTGTSGPVYLNMSAQDVDNDLNKRSISSITLMEVAG